MTQVIIIIFLSQVQGFRVRVYLCSRFFVTHGTQFEGVREVLHAPHSESVHQVVFEPGSGIAVRALPTETEVESGTSQSNSRTSFNSRNSEFLALPK